MEREARQYMCHPAQAYRGKLENSKEKEEKRAGKRIKIAQRRADCRRVFFSREFAEGKVQKP